MKFVRSKAWWLRKAAAEPDVLIGAGGAFCAPGTRSWLARFWSRLGFGTAHVDPPADLEGWAPSYMITGTRIHMDWRDRFRVLVSGRAMVQILTKTDVPVGRMRSVSSFSVLPPGSNMS